VFDPTVRLACEEEVDQLELLEAEARAALILQRGGTRWLETHSARRADDWAAAIAADDVHVAVLDGVVVGYLVSDTAGEIARIDDVYVSPGARQVGFGDALIETVIEAARAAGCRAIEGEALPGDRETKNLYERAGITARLIIVAKSLETQRIGRSAPLRSS
jgi:ribosomal protein S18 acetylase RimI-like enzyme